MERRKRNGANGMSDIEGKATRVGASERGQRTSFKAERAGFDRRELAKKERKQEQRTAVRDPGNRLGKVHYYESLDFNSGRCRCDVGAFCLRAAAAHSGADAKWQDRAVDRATGSEFWKRPVHPFVDRWKTGGEHSAEPALRRIYRSRATHGDGAGIAEHGSAAADVDATDRESGTGLHFHRELGFRPARSYPEQLLHADDKGGGSKKVELRTKKAAALRQSKSGTFCRTSRCVTSGGVIRK